MRVLYVASQPDDGNQLNIGREIHEIQTRLLSRNLPDFEFAFFSDLTVERLRSTIANYKPDILHISGHSDHGEYRFRNDLDQVVVVNGKTIAALIPPHAVPKLGVFSSCNSTKVFAESTIVLPAYLSFTGMVVSSVAVSVALQMYEELVTGQSIEQAYQSCQARLTLEQPGTASAELTGEKQYLQSTILYRPPTIVARLTTKKLRGTKKGDVRGQSIEIGLDGAPSDLVQVVFFTDERGWADEAEYSNDIEIPLECWRASKLAKVVYGPTPIGGCIWSQTKEMQDADERLYAVAVRASGTNFLVRSSVSEGLVNAILRGLARDDTHDMIHSFASQLRNAARTHSVFYKGETDVEN